MASSMWPIRSPWSLSCCPCSIHRAIPLLHSRYSVEEFSFILFFSLSSAGTCITKYRTTECGVLIAVVVVVVAGPSFRPPLPLTLAGLKACRLASTGDARWGRRRRARGRVKFSGSRDFNRKTAIAMAIATAAATASISICGVLRLQHQYQRNRVRA